MTFITAPRRRTALRPALFSELGRLVAIWRQRRALETLDNRALEDIGVSRAQADAEARRAFWDAPATWRH
ncbi:MAG: DUF1127 domain-containing protein [Pseudodonghicola sp.]|nr:DUF1127 domain-containing protein [Pseudodonghicola sp.]